MTGPSHRDQRRALLERLWIGAVLSYAGVRIWLADRFFARYGVNIAVFAAIEVLSSLVYAFASARLVGALIDNKRSRAWEYGLLTVFGFAIPDLFVVLVAKEVPRSLYIIGACVVAISAVFSLLELRKKVRKSRRAASAG
jgi:hypothetical protein